MNKYLFTFSEGNAYDYTNWEQVIEFPCDEDAIKHANSCEWDNGFDSKKVISVYLIERKIK